MCTPWGLPTPAAHPSRSSQSNGLRSVGCTRPTSSPFTHGAGYMSAYSQSFRKTSVRYQYVCTTSRKVVRLSPFAGAETQMQRAHLWTQRWKGSRLRQVLFLSSEVKALWSDLRTLSYISWVSFPVENSQQCSAQKWCLKIILNKISLGMYLLRK